MATSSALDAIFHHVFLPPKLPQQGKPEEQSWLPAGPSNFKRRLVNEVCEALRTFSSSVTDVELKLLNDARAAVNSLASLRNEEGVLDHNLITHALRDATTTTLAFEVQAQNAGILIVKRDNLAVFHLFELSPRNDDVFATNGRLTRTFPGSSLEINMDLLRTNFCDCLVDKLINLDIHIDERCRPTTKKGGQTITENRETMNPTLITDLLCGILRSVGQPHKYNLIQKQTREDVIYSTNEPWRRSPLWLCIRVVMQLCLRQEAKNEGPEDHTLYKNLMVHFHVHILGLFLRRDCDPEFLQLMNAKIAWRTSKLPAEPRGNWSDNAQKVLAKATTKLEQWARNLETRPQIPKLPFVDIEAAKSHELRAFHDYIKRTQRKETNLRNENNLFPSPILRFDVDRIPSLVSSANIADQEQELLKVELWVAHDFDSWLQKSLKFEEECLKIGRLLQEYRDAAFACYSQSPEHMSTAILTAMDLWIGLDKACAHHYPLLKQYPTKMPTDIFSALLLPHSQQSLRLARIEAYVLDRETQARPNLPWPLFDKISANGFANVFMSNSAEMQSILEQILAKGEKEAQQKREEFRSQMKRYDDLSVKEKALLHENITLWSKQNEHYYTKHDLKCKKCNYLKERNAITIDPYEMPLPDDPVLQQAIVFELCRPRLYSSWRHETFDLLTRLLGSDKLMSTLEDKPHPLRTHDKLQQFQKIARTDLSLVSTKKAFARTHYQKQKNISNFTETSIVLKHGSSWHLASEGGLFFHQTTFSFTNFSVKEKCSFKLDKGPMSKLQKAVSTCHYNSNTALSEQNLRDPSMSPDEWYNFATLRDGPLLQLRNLARNLRSGDMTLKDDASFTLIAHVLWEAGPPGECERVRATFLDLKDDNFASKLIDLSLRRAQAVASNWEALGLVKCCIFIVLKVRTINKTREITKSCDHVLRELREISLQWSRTCSESMRDAEPESSSQMLSIALESALVSLQTFDNDLADATTVLYDSRDTAAFVEMSIRVRQFASSSTEISQLKPSIQYLMRRWFRIRHDVSGEIVQAILFADQGLDVALSMVWKGYEKLGAWRQCNDEFPTWVEVQGTTSQNQFMVVQYDTYSGEFLVQGKLLSRVPEEYTSNTLYQTLFAGSRPQILASRQIGMAYETSEMIENCIIHFGMVEKELVILLEHGNSVLQMIPSRVFAKDLSSPSVRGFVFWYNERDGTVIRRLAKGPLKDIDPWTISLVTPIEITNDNRYELNTNHAAIKQIASVLEPLDARENMIVEYDRRSDQLLFRLARAKLDFEYDMQAQILYCTQRPGMQVAEDQDIGALTGLTNVLVLEDSGGSRGVLIPYGEVGFTYENHFTNVWVKLDFSLDRRILFFEIDSALQRLRDDGTQTSMLYRAYLHALTSLPVPDSLTGITGIEEALDIMASARLNSAQELAADDCELLSKISRLCETRQFYPKGMRCMQTVKWGSLPQLSHNFQFGQLVAEKIQHVHDLNTLLPSESLKLPKLAGVEIILRERAILRQFSFRRQAFSGSCEVQRVDNAYEGRDIPRDLEARIYQVGSLVASEAQKFHAPLDLLRELENWKLVLEPPQIGLNTIMLTIPSDDNFKPHFARYWLTWVKTLQEMPKSDKHLVIFWLSSLAWNLKISAALLEILLAFFNVDELKTLPDPETSMVDLSCGYSYKQVQIHENTKLYMKPILVDPLPLKPSDEERATAEKVQEERITVRDQMIKKICNDLKRHYDSGENLTVDEAERSEFTDVEEFLKICHSLAARWRRNGKFKDWITSIQSYLRGHRRNEDTPIFHSKNRLGTQRDLSHAIRPLATVLTGPCTVDPTQFGPQGLSSELYGIAQLQDKRSVNLSDALLDRVTNFVTKARQRHPDDEDYFDNLNHSLKDLSRHAKSQTMIEAAGRATGSDMTLNLVHEAKSVYQACLKIVTDSLTKSTDFRSQLIFAGGCHPRLTTTSLLTLLTWKSHIRLHPSWKKIIVMFALTLFNYQRSRRLEKLKDNSQEFAKESSNVGHQNWDPLEHPEWLIFEIENDLCIRPQQIELLQEMISPMSGKSAVMQLNMGEGKTSVIAPLAAAALADGKTLVRVIVLKPLLRQAFDILAARLGGLLGHVVKRAPISRQMQPDLSAASRIHEFFGSCVQNRAILVLQPDHVMSFTLLGRELMLQDGDKKQAGLSLYKTQRWLDQVTRDILDESDESLDVKYELIYSMGIPQPMDFTPERWVLILDLLDLFESLARNSAVTDGLLCSEVGTDRFPFMQFADHSQILPFIEKVAKAICHGHLPRLNLYSMTRSNKEELFTFLTSKEPDLNPPECIQVLFAENSGLKSKILILKGLLGGGVLAHCFSQKRYRVNYGLNIGQTLAAVPYRAKDLPKDRAEFSHTDLTIILTALCYFYKGLTNEELENNFRQLMAIDSRSQEYERWLTSVAPANPRWSSLEGLNFRDSRSKKELFDALRYQKPVIRFYLTSVVFPKAIYGFPHKLSSSAWDLAKLKTKPTTGFSGTNDSQYVLPTTIRQHDLPQLLMTNALMLTRLVDPSNLCQTMPPGVAPFLVGRELIKIITNLHPTVHVLIDVGAQIVDLTNEKVAQAILLQTEEHVERVIYFDQSDQLCVLSRDGSTFLLFGSPFASNLESSFVYIDQAHSRGTDLKLPTTYRAVVTLGLGVTKDVLAQACMRMRKLGQGQTITFLLPKGIELETRKTALKGLVDPLNAEDVVHWAIGQTLKERKQSTALWRTQGHRYYERQRLISSWKSVPTVPDVRTLLEPEMKTIETMYGRPALHRHQFASQLETFPGDQGLEILRSRSQHLRESDQNLTSAYEEQERELHPDVERESHQKSLPKMKPMLPSSTDDVTLLVTQGVFRNQSTEFISAGELLQKTSLKKYNIRLPSSLLVTRDFCETVKEAKDNLDNFLRPVHWILSFRRAIPVLEEQIIQYLIISPFEANKQLPAIRSSQHVRLHTYCARTKLSMPSFESLEFLALGSRDVWQGLKPSFLMDIELGLFAGRLFCRDRKDYEQMCRYLSLCYKMPLEDLVVAANGYVPRKSRLDYDPQMKSMCSSELTNKAPNEFLRWLLNFRRKGVSITETHMGKILDGTLLTDADFVNGLQQEVDQ